MGRGIGSGLRDREWVKGLGVDKGVWSGSRDWEWVKG